MKSMIEKCSKKRVSSVLNNNVKQFGKQFLFDGNEETCWNSDQGAPQWIGVVFEEPFHLQEIQLMFHGGFVGKRCHLEAHQDESSGGDGSQLKTIMEFFPRDDNSCQSFPVDGHFVVRDLRIIFHESTDFFGRITVYRLDILGTPI